MSLQSFLTNDQVNVVELYFCPESIEANSYVFQCGWKELPRLPVHLFKNRLDQQLTEYYHRDLIYSYDRSNDAQRTYQRTWIQDDLQGPMYTVAYQEESLPTHRFPCLQEINEKKTFHKIHYKINNRMYFILEKDETDWWYIDDFGVKRYDNDCFVFYTLNTIIKFLHQLQNLYFALTGEELTINQ